MDLVGMRENEVRERLAAGEISTAQRAEARNFLNRRGRFALMDRSEPDREQVFPGEPPPDIEQTHERGGYRDGA